MRSTGFGIIEKKGDQLNYLISGCVRTQPGDLPARIKVIVENLNQIITEYRPEQAAIEQVFVNSNPRSTLLLGQARGAAICAAVINNLIVAEYTALQIKQAVVGNGHAHKNQVQLMVKKLLVLATEPGMDAADALACAICHAHGGLGLGRFSALSFRVRRGRWS